MGLLTNRVKRSEIKPGDHIYTYRAVFTYSHHGIFVGENKVVHFTPDRDLNSRTWTSSDSSFYNLPLTCSSYPECGFRQPNSGVVRSCLDCFLGNGSLHRFEYGISRALFLAHVRGGTCSIAKSDPPEAVIHRALYLLRSGFGNYDVFQNNCEDFALYCKTGLRVVEKKNTDIGTSGQVCSVSSVFGAPLVAILSSPLKLLVPSPVGVATVTAGMYLRNRYKADIGVRTDVINMPVEDLAASLGWASHHEEVANDSEASKQDFVAMNSITSGSTRCGATSAGKTLCFCKRPACVRTTYTQKNFGRRFMICENYKSNQACGFWKWIDPKMCEHGERLVNHLWQRHLTLNEEVARCQTMVETEIGKVKAKMEIEIGALRKEIEIAEIQYQAMTKNFQTIVACLRIFLILYLFMIGSTSKSVFDDRLDCMTLP